MTITCPTPPATRALMRLRLDPPPIPWERCAWPTPVAVSARDQ